MLGDYRSALKLHSEHLDLACREGISGFGMALDASRFDARVCKAGEIRPQTRLKGTCCTGQNLANCDVDIINKYIGASFEAMKEFGPQVFRPFMQVCTQPRRFSLHAAFVWQDGYLHAALL